MPLTTRVALCLPILCALSVHAFAEDALEDAVRADDVESCVVAQSDAEPGSTVESTWTVNQDVVFRTESGCEIVNESECSVIKTWTESMATPIGECERTCSKEVCYHTGYLKCIGLPPMEVYSLQTESTTCTDCEENPV